MRPSFPGHFIGRIVAVYSIKDLEMISGIKAHTLRIWEQRYHIIRPQRTPTNIRYYEEDDLRHLLHISLLNKHGYKISKIASMPKEAIASAVAELSEGAFEDTVQIDTLTIAMMELNEAKFETILASNIRELGFERSMLDVVYPFLDKLTLLWLTGSIHTIHENFISHLIRQKIISAIEALPLQSDAKERFILYLPEGETQELSLLLISYLIRKRGYGVLYLGKELTLSDLEEASLLYPATHIVTIISEGFGKRSVRQYLDDLIKVCQGKRLLLSGYQVFIQGISTSNEVHVLQDMVSIAQYIDSLHKE